MDKDHRPDLPRPRLIVLGAGSRGNSYARAVTEAGSAVVAAVAEPIAFKRREFVRKYISTNGILQEEPQPDQEFESWQHFLRYETQRRERQARGEEGVPAGFDGIFVCTLDHTHCEIVTQLAPLGIHMMVEKPLAATLEDCVSIYRALKPAQGTPPRAIFSICHVLRYSPHNLLLRKLLLEDEVIGDILTLEHTEPVGWWHYAHSYVRGNWRRSSVSAPSLLTKCCHDIDLILWLLCSSPASAKQVSGRGEQQSHLPSSVSSSGSLSYFRRSRKPAAAKDATNCLSCPIEPDCIYSAKQIYVDRHLIAKHDTGWPVKIVAPEIEECYREEGLETAQKMLEAALAEDYDRHVTPRHEIDARPWFGRCVWESDNDVVDNQVVNITWDEEVEGTETVEEQQQHTTTAPPPRPVVRGAKSATVHMVAFTEKQCERRGRVYGTLGEIEYDSACIQVHSFVTGQTQTHHPPQPGGGHGGGDDGLARQFVRAIEAVRAGQDVEGAQREHIGCTLDEVVRSHAMVFAAEEARTQRRVVDWRSWWRENVERRLNGDGHANGDDDDDGGDAQQQQLSEPVVVEDQACA